MTRTRMWWGEQTFNSQTCRMRYSIIKKRLTVGHNYNQHSRNLNRKRNIGFEVVINWRPTSTNEWYRKRAEYGQEHIAGNASCNDKQEMFKTKTNVTQTLVKIKQKWNSVTRSGECVSYTLMFFRFVQFKERSTVRAFEVINYQHV